VTSQRLAKLETRTVCFRSFLSEPSPRHGKGGARGLTGKGLTGEGVVVTDWREGAERIREREILVLERRGKDGRSLCLPGGTGES
jgi:hypothetical protein